MAYTTISRTNGFPQPTDGQNGNLTITGRTLTHYTIGGATQLNAAWTVANVGVNPYVAGSTFDTLVRAIEQVGSIELLGDPTGATNLTTGQFRVAISGAAPAATTGAYSLQGYCNTAVNGSGVAGATVTAFTY